MTVHPVLRWSAPAVAAAAVIAGAQVVTRDSASAAPTLPDRTAHQVLTDLLGAHPASLSGTVEASTHLGLPDLPKGAVGGGSASGMSPVDLLQGDHTLRVWYATPDKARVAVLGDGSEIDAVTDGRDAWLWNSTKQQAWHLRAPDSHRISPEHRKSPGPADMARFMTPSGMATWALSMLKPTTKVTTASNVTVAGRAAYQLTFTPKTSKTRIGSIRLAVDAQKHVPLRAQVYAKGSHTPAINVGFTSVSFKAQPDSRFTFTPPSGARVHQVRPQAGKQPAGSPPEVKTVGSGWSSVLVLTSRNDATGPDSKASDLPTGALDALPRVSGAWGSGRLLKSTLISAVVTADGRVAIGAVSPDQLYAALERG